MMLPKNYAELQGKISLTCNFRDITFW